MNRPARRLSVLAVAVIALLAAAPGLAPAVVPPRDCGSLRVNDTRYQVKVDQISCRSGKSYARNYLARRSKPSGYRCRQYPSRRNRVRFYCNKGRQVFFAIRRS